MKKDTQKLKPLTISSGELRYRVEEQLDRFVRDDVWKRSEEYARKKLERLKEEHPELYTNSYLTLLTVDTVRETEFSDFTIMDCETKMAASRNRKEPAWLK